MKNYSGGARLAGKVALVTGSSRGIGAAIAERFAREGAGVALHGRDAGALGEVQARIEAEGGRAIAVTGDVTRYADVEAMRAEVPRALGPIDILVANAGGAYARPGLVEEITEDEWRLSVDNNLTSTFFCVKSVLPGMKARKSGTIITVSSAAARRPHPRSPVPYACAKAALELLTQDVAMQAGPFGIRANCIAPETILTAKNHERIPDAMKTELALQHPLRRLGTPDDVAEAALFLASDASSWITGTILDVAGGAVMV